jgi:ubiquinone/menaquinone biosynthesis C-methylase UbiE
MAVCHSTAVTTQTDSVRSLFDSEALDYVRSREQQHSFQSQKEIVLEMLRGSSGRALDIGCGPAMMEEALLERGLEVWGIDVSERMIEYGKARIARHPQAGRCHLALGNAERLSCADGFYDAILSMGVLEYLPDYEPAIREMHRALRNGGIAVLSVPSRVSAYHVARRGYHQVRAVAARLAHRQPAALDSVAVDRCVPWRLDRQLAQYGLRKLASRSCNFIFFPLHEKLPGVSLAVNRRLGPLSGSPLGLLLGAQYIVKVQKRG